MQNIWRKPKEVFQKLKDIAEPMQVLGAMLWRAGPVLLSSYFLLELINSIMPVVQLLAIKYMVDNIMLLQMGDEQALWNLLFWIGIFVLKMIVEAVSASLGEWLSQTLGEKSRILINNELLDAINAEDTLRYYEEPEYRNRLETLRDSTNWLPIQLLRFPILFVSTLISMTGVLLVVADLSILLAVLLLVSFVPYASRQNKFRMDAWDEEYQLAPLRRKMSYSRNTVLSPHTVKEIKLFQNGTYFEDLYQDAFLKMYQRVFDNQRKGARGIATTGIFSGIIVGLGYVWIVWEAMQGNLSPGNVALFLTAIYELARYAKDTSAGGSLALEVWQMGKDFIAFIRQDTKEKKTPVANETSPLEIKLEHVSFTYPHTNEPVLEDINLTIQAGEKVAIVGENGSGKTTLVKLLCHFYEPTFGKVLINGKEANRAHRKKISVVFQDFGRYAFPISTNIALGKMDEMENQDRVQRSAKFSGIHQSIVRFPEKYHTMLGRDWGGAELSGGQWQKVAIARSYYRQAQLLILDEPTASLDIRSEYEIYDRFAEYTEGKTTIIISHRFSTVKMADRIIVLKDGKMIEEGSHQELMDLDGEYAGMYSKQAELFYVKEGESIESLG